MKQLILLTLDSLTYGAWKHEIESVCDPGPVHRLPGNPSWFAGIAFMDGKTTCFCDLQACLGLPALASKNRPALIMSGSNTTEGFLIESGGETIDVNESSIYPMPAYMRCPGIETAVFYQEKLIPVLKLTEIYNWILRGEMKRPVPALIRDTAMDGLHQTGRFRLFTLCDDVFAIGNESVDHVGTLQAFTHPLYARPDDLKGIMFDGERIRAVIEPAALLGYRPDTSAKTVLFLKDGGPAIIVHSDEGTATIDRPVPLPPVAASDLFKTAVLLSGTILPVITISSLLSSDGDGFEKDNDIPLAQLPHLFLERWFEVMEFSTAGITHGIPASQVKDVIPVGPYRRIPKTNPLLVGVAEHEGQILPVVDPGLFFGRCTSHGDNARMILLDIEGFRLLLLSETVPVGRSLSVEDRKEMPLKLPHRFVYGCYIDNNTVRLILDIATIIAHLDGTEQDEDWASMIDFLGLSEEARPAPEANDIPIELNKSAEEGRSHNDLERSDRKESLTVGFPEAVSVQNENAHAGDEEYLPAGDDTPQAERTVEKNVQQPWARRSEDDSPSDHLQDDPLFDPSRAGEDAPASDGYVSVSVKTSLDIMKEHMQQSRPSIRNTLVSKTQVFIREKKLPVAIMILMILLAGISLRGGRDETLDKTIKHPHENTASAFVKQRVSPPLVEKEKIAREEEKTLLLELERESGKISMKMVSKAPEDTVSYVVQKGDTLWHIAERFTGNPFRYHTIAKESEIQNPDLIYPGQTVLIAITSAR